MSLPMMFMDSETLSRYKSHLVPKEEIRFSLCMVFVVFTIIRTKSMHSVNAMTMEMYLFGLLTVSLIARKEDVPVLLERLKWSLLFLL